MHLRWPALDRPPCAPASHARQPRAGTIYPLNIAWAATFDDELARRAASQIGDEMRAHYNRRAREGWIELAYTNCFGPHVHIVRWRHSAALRPVRQPVRPSMLAIPPLLSPAAHTVRMLAAAVDACPTARCRLGHVQRCGWLSRPQGEACALCSCAAVPALRVSALLAALPVQGPTLGAAGRDVWRGPAAAGQHGGGARDGPAGGAMWPHRVVGTAPQLMVASPWPAARDIPACSACFAHARAHHSVRHDDGRPAWPRAARWSRC